MKIFCIFCSGGGTRTHDLQVMSLASYQLLHPAMFGYDGRSRTSIPYWATFMKNNLPLPPFDIISWRKYTTSLSHHSIHLSVMFIKENKIQKKKVIKLTV